MEQASAAPIFLPSERDFTLRGNEYPAVVGDQVEINRVGVVADERIWIALDATSVEFLIGKGTEHILDGAQILILEATRR